MRASHPLLALCAALLCACESVREARRAQDPATAVLGERVPAAGELGLPGSGSVALDDLVQAALHANPAVVRARYDVQAAAARVREAEGARLPQLSANASAATTSGDHDFYSLGFSLSWLLFDFGQSSALARQAAESWLAAQSDLLGVETETAYGVRSAYFGLEARQELVVVADETVQQFQTRLEQVQGFVAAGTRIPYDETKAQVDLENARLAEVRARDAVLLAQATLAHAVGLQEVVDWQPQEEAPLPELPADFDAAWALAREHEPSLAAAAARERAASALVDARIARLYPSLSAAGGALESGASFPLSWSSTIGAALAWVPFDGFQNLSSIDEAAASLRSARTSHSAAEEQVWLELRTAWLALEDAHKRLGPVTLAEQYAQQNLALAQGRFDVGKATSVELADAQEALAEARADRVQARSDERSSRALLVRWLGIAQEGKHG